MLLGQKVVDGCLLQFEIGKAALPIVLDFEMLGLRPHSIDQPVHRAWAARVAVDREEFLLEPRIIDLQCTVLDASLEHQQHQLAAVHAALPRVWRVKVIIIIIITVIMMIIIITLLVPPLLLLTSPK